MLPFVLVAFLIQMLVILPLLMMLHLAVQGSAARLFGARPTYGVELSYGGLPTLYCTVPGHGFTRSQYAVVTAAPPLLLLIAGVSRA